MTKLFQIITDSSCDLPQSLADELDLRVLPLHVTIDGKTYNNYLDGREIAFKDFFDNRFCCDIYISFSCSFIWRNFRIFWRKNRLGNYEVCRIFYADSRPLSHFIPSFNS